MFWLLYNVLFTIGYVAAVPRYLLRMRRRGGYRRGFMQRFAVYDAAAQAKLRGVRRLWIHGVSVGEMYVVLRFIEEWRRADPEVGFVVSTTTSTGHALAQRNLSERDLLLYFPCDFPGVARRVLERVHPRALILAEAELWPNMIRHCAARGIPVALINGRISDSSYKGYRWARPLMRRVLGHLSLLLMQTARDRDRVVALGAAPDRVEVVGSAKYDLSQAEPGGVAKAQQILREAGIDPGATILLGGSTWPGEESVLLDTYESLRREHAELKLVLVPRHMERRAEVEAELQQRNLRYIKRTAMGGETAADASAEHDVLLVDTTGELKDLYACATVIFIGKSLTEHGGQNILEPAALGKPVLVGPYMENFVEITAEFVAAGAIVQVQDAAELHREMEALLASPTRRDALGRKAAALIESKRGVVARSVALMKERVGI